MILPGHDVHGPSCTPPVLPSMMASRTPARRARTGAVSQFPSLLPGDPAPSPDRHRNPSVRTAADGPQSTKPNTALARGLRWRSELIDMKGTCLLTMTWVHTGGQSLDTLDVCQPPVSTTLRRPDSAVINSGATRMANLQCPLERLSERVHSILRMVTTAATADNHIDATERRTIDELRAVTHELVDFSARRKLARHIEQLDTVTDYTHRLAKAADLDVVDLAAQRRQRSANVVTFPTRKSAG